MKEESKAPQAQYRTAEPDSQDAYAIIAAIKDLKLTVERISFWVTLFGVFTLAGVFIVVIVLLEGGSDTSTGF